MQRLRFASSCLLLLSLNQPTGLHANASAEIGPFIFGNLPEVRLHETIFGATEQRCLVFRVGSGRVEPMVLIMTAGLGDSLLAEADTSGCPPFDDARWHRALALALPEAYRPARIALRLDPALAQAGDLAEGQIVVLDRSGARTSAALKVGPPKANQLWTAFQWFLGFLIPSALGLLIGRAAISWDAARKEKREFDAFRELEDARIKKACADIKSAFAQGMENPGHYAYKILLNAQILNSLPRRQRGQLVQHCQTNDRKFIVHLMKELFPTACETLT